MKTIKLTTGKPDDFPELLFKAINAGTPLFFYPEENIEIPDDNIYTYIIQNNLLIVFTPILMSRKDKTITDTNYMETLDDLFIISDKYFLNCATHSVSTALYSCLLDRKKIKINSKTFFRNECMDVCPKIISDKCINKLKVIVQAQDLPEKHCLCNDNTERYFPDMLLNKYTPLLLRQKQKTIKAAKWEPI